jgi:hypothetical protein
MESKNETIRILHAQPQVEREAKRRADMVIAQLAQANAALITRMTEWQVLLTEPANRQGLWERCG